MGTQAHQVLSLVGYMLAGFLWDFAQVGENVGPNIKEVIK